MEDPTELLDSKAELDQEEMERLLRENRALKGRLDELERENRLLKQRNFDLSMRYGRSAENRRQPFELVFSDSDQDEGRADNDGGGGGNSSDGTDNNEASGAGYSIEESESGRDGNSGNESAEGATAAYDTKIQPRAARTSTGKNHSNSDGPAASVFGKSKTSVGPEELGSSKGTVAAPAESKKVAGAEASGVGLPSSVVRVREKQRRVLDISDADRDGSARHADVESAPAKDKRSMRDSEERHGGGSGSAAGGPSRRKEAKQLKCYAELDGHEGAIYSTQYSGSGGLVASASFDKTVRVWDIGEQKSVAVLEGHEQSVFDVAWREDSAA
ncbi:hypothetical protein GGI21_002761, partial [Coemansia aciculifera]